MEHIEPLINGSPVKFVNLEQELGQRARQQAVVAQLGQRALIGADLQALLDEAVASVAGTLRVPYCKVLELLPGGEALLLKAGVGWKTGLVGAATVGTGLDSQAGYTLYAAGPVIVDDLRQETRFDGPALLSEHGVVSGMSVIIQGQPRPYGVLAAHSTERRAFTQDDVNFLWSVANVLAAAIERKRVEGQLIERSAALAQRSAELGALNADLEKRVRERTGSVRLLQQVTAAANQADTAQAAYQFVLERVCADLHCQVGHVFLANCGPELAPAEVWQVQDPQRFATFRQATMETRLLPAAGLPGQAFSTRLPVWFTEVSREVNFPRRAAALQCGLRSGFALPVLVGEEVAAVLEFFSTHRLEPDPLALEVMANIGTQLGRVVERERARAQLLHSNAELSHSRALLAEAQQLAHIGSWDWEILEDTVHWSEELYRIYGVEPGSFAATYEGYLELIHPDDRAQVQAVIADARAAGRPYQLEHRVLRPDGALRTVYAEGKVLQDEAGRPVRMLGICQDITDRRRMEEALRQSLAMFENLFESAPDGTLLVDEAGRILRMNRQMERMSGFRRAELAGQPLETLLPERFQAAHSLRRAGFLRDPQRREMGQTLELYARRKDGSEFPVDILLSPLQTEAGLQVIAVVRDVTRRRQAEEALRQSEARFRSVFEGAALGMALVDLERRILVSNPRLQQILGYSAEELRGMDSLAITYPPDADATQALYRELLGGQSPAVQLEKRYFRKDGQVIWAAETISLMRDAQGDPSFGIAMMEDITSRKQMEAELAEVQLRLMAGRELERTQLAQELHDVPLQDLYALLYGLDEFGDALQNPQRFLELKESFAEGLRGLITTLRGIMGELRPPTLSPFGLEGAIREHAEGFGAKHPSLAIHLDLMPDDQQLTEEVRLNLFRIYQQALSNVARHAGAANVFVRFHFDEQHTRLEIEDDGQGFQVPSRWLGLTRAGHLGLAGSAERAELIGGRFHVSSAPGHGTRLTVSVPRVKEEQ